MVTATVPLEEIAVQLLNEQITTPAEVHFARNKIEVRLIAGNRAYHFEFALVGSKVRLVVRAFDMDSDDVTVSPITLHDFLQPPAAGAFVRFMAEWSGANQASSPIFKYHCLYTLMQIEVLAGRRATRNADVTHLPNHAAVNGPHGEQYDFAGVDDQHLILLWIDNQRVSG